MLHLLASNPWRPPDSSWQRATRLVEIGDDEPRATYRRDSRSCSWIRRAQRFQHALNHATTHRQRSEVLAEYPVIFQAHSIWQKLATDELAIPLGIEARILARENAEAIAQKNACPSDVVTAYEALFFDIRSRLGFSDFISTCVIGPAPAQHLKGEATGWLWKLFGYVGGPHVLDALMGHIPSPIWVHNPDDVPPFLRSTVINMIKKNASVAALAIPVEDRTQMPLIELFAKCMMAEGSTDSSSNVGDAIQENLRMMLESLPFTTAGKAKTKQSPNLDPVCAGESTSEPLQVALGNPEYDTEKVNVLRFAKSNCEAANG